MRLEVGKTYRTRDGAKALISDRIKSDIYPFEGRIMFPDSTLPGAWEPDGSFSRNGVTSRWDIISEWTDENTDRAQLAALDASSGFNAQASSRNDVEAFLRNSNSSDDAKAKTRIDVDYWPLKAILNEALEQAASGKGSERHANGRPFDRQPIMEHGRLTGPAGPSFQALKKIGEAQGMLARGEKDAAIRELLGAIVYASAAVHLIKETGR